MLCNIAFSFNDTCTKSLFLKESAALPYSLPGLGLPLIINGEDYALRHSFNDY